MATPARKPEYVTERLTISPVPKDRIDREKGIVHSVRIANPESGNGRYYPPAVLKAAAQKYEGKPVYWGHRKRPTDTDDPTPRFGTLRNVRPADGGGLEADLHLNPKKTHSEDFFWACENDPHFYCLSPHHLIRWNPRLDSQGRKVADDIEAVASVDVVSEGGTTTGVFENDQSGATMTPQEVAATVTDAAALDTWLKDFFAALTLDAATKQAAAQTLLDSLATAEPTDPAVAMESLRKLGGTGRWAANKLDGYFTKESQEASRTKALDLCKKGGLTDAQISEVFLETVTEAKSDDRASALIAERKSLLAGAKPPNPPKTTPPGGGGKTSVKDIVAGLDA